MKKGLLFVGVLLVLAIGVAAQRATTSMSSSNSPAVPGKPQSTVVFTQSREEVRLRELEHSVTTLSAELEALKERVAKLEENR